MSEWTPFACPVCGRETCDNPAHLPPPLNEDTADTVPTLHAHPSPPAGLNPDYLANVSAVVAEGQQLEANGIPYTVDEIVPAYGGLGMLVAKPKVGKTTIALQLGAAVACGLPFLDRMTKQTRVLVIAAEDPPPYTAWLARHLHDVPADTMTFYRGPIRLDPTGLAAIACTVTAGHYGLVLIASWQAVICGLVQHENDNAAIVNIMERTKRVARETDIPWLVDAHAGKGEDQSDDADPSMAMRGASSAAASADYTLSLRYADNPFSTKRRLSGKGRFVNFAPLLLDCEADHLHYTLVGGSKTVLRESTWQLLVTMGALTEKPQTAYALALAIGLTGPKGRPNASSVRQVRDALYNRPGIRRVTEERKGQTCTLYSQTLEALETEA